MDRWIKNVVVIGLILGFLLPAAGFTVTALRGSNGISQSENRTLAKLPSLQTDIRRFTTEFDQFLEDNFGFRMLLIRTARKVRDNLGENPPRVAVGQDGWLFLNSNRYRDEFEGNGRWNASNVQTWIDSLLEINASLAERDIPFAAFVAVDKARAYPEMLPSDWREGDRRFRTALYAHPRAEAAGLIDAEHYIVAAKDQGLTTFYHRDTHWTASGTYTLAMAVMDRLDPTNERPRYDPPAAKQVATTRLLDLEAMAGFATTQEPSHMMIGFPTPQPNFRTSITLLDDGTPDPGQFSTLRILGTEDAPQGTLVIVGDSFGDAMVGHFWPSYSQIIRIHHGAHLKTVTLEEVLQYNPDAVLFATAERQAFPKTRPLAALQPQ